MVAPNSTIGVCLMGPFSLNGDSRADAQKMLYLCPPYWPSSHSLNGPCLFHLRAIAYRCGGERDDLELDLGLRPGFTSCLLCNLEQIS